MVEELEHSYNAVGGGFLKMDCPRVLGIIIDEQDVLIGLIGRPTRSIPIF